MKYLKTLSCWILVLLLMMFVLSSIEKSYASDESMRSYPAEDTARYKLIYLENYPGESIELVFEYMAIKCKEPVVQIDHFESYKKVTAPKGKREVKVHCIYVRYFENNPEAKCPEQKLTKECKTLEIPAIEETSHLWITYPSNFRLSTVH